MTLNVEHSRDNTVQPLSAAVTDYNTLFINRDLSLLEFFRRVLEEALDKDQLPLERLKFVTILSSILDEFFMIRVAGLKEKQGREIGVSPDGYSTDQLLAEIRLRVDEMAQAQMKCLREEIMPDLAGAGIEIVPVSSLSAAERQHVDDEFENCIYPILTPQAVDPTHPFPYISGGSTNIGVFASPQLNRRTARAIGSKEHEFFVRIKIPPHAEPLIPISEGSEKFVLLEDLVISNIKRLLPEADPLSCHIFRITRDADGDLREAETEDLLETMEQNLKRRRFGDVVRLEVAHSMPRKMVDYLTRSLQIDESDVYAIDGPVTVSALSGLYKLNRPDLKDKTVVPFVPAALADGVSKFEVLKKQDILLHHPYNPYTIVTDFLREAVDDPDVLAIKMCLYRIGADSPIAPLLIQASEAGKQVTAVIEIKARFDEANNIEWAKRMEQAGVHVVYGILGLKTHCKATLVVRSEGDRLVRYVHVATGNYNPETSAFYTDLGLLTADQEIGEDVTELFNYLTAYSHRDNFKKIAVAPISLREKGLALIARETEHAKYGRPARIIAKMNRLADPEVVRALYAASEAGVQIDLIVRGVCTLRPGIPGLSENIRVRSIVGQLLEHSRVYYFENGGEAEVYTGSSDWMPRNLDRRVEVITPVEDPELKSYLRDELLATYLRDNVKARQMMPDGSYRRVERDPDDLEVNSQTWFQAPSNILKFEKAHN
jgi:polyphosphate kinase